MHAWEETEDFDDEERSRDGKQNGITTTLMGKGVFPDSSQMKEQLREQMLRPQYNVHDLYKKTGFTQWVARQQRFENLTLLVIAFNAIWIGVDTDQNSASILLEAPPLYQMIEHFFCIYFSFEWTIRFLAFKHKRNGFRDAWFCFDSCLVTFLVFETWIMSAIVLMSGGGSSIGSPSILRMARLLRLSRMARMVRLFRAMPELLILIKGLAASVRSMLFTLMLLFSIVYVFAIAFKQLCDGADCEPAFSSVSEAIHTLWLNGALMDDVGMLVEPLERQGIFMLVLFYTYLLLTALTMMNMLIGVICEVVSAVSSTEKEALMLSYVRDQIKALMIEGDFDENQNICKEEFLQLLHNKAAANILQDTGVDVVGLVDVADTIFEANPEDADEDRSLSFAEFMNLVLDLRGSNTATLKDITELRRHINSKFSHLENKILEHLDVSLRRSPDSPSWISQDDHPTAPREHHRGKSDSAIISPPTISAGIFQKGVCDSSNLPLFDDDRLEALRSELRCAKQELSKYRSFVKQQTTPDARAAAQFSPEACVAVVPGASICRDGTITLDLDEELSLVEVSAPEVSPEELVWVPCTKDSVTAIGDVPLQDRPSGPGGSGRRPRASGDVPATASDVRNVVYSPGSATRLQRATGSPGRTDDGRGASRGSRASLACLNNIL